MPKTRSLPDVIGSISQHRTIAADAILCELIGNTMGARVYLPLHPSCGMMPWPTTRLADTARHLAGETYLGSPESE